MRRILFPLLLTSLFLIPAARAQEKSVEMDDATKKATARALAWLKDKQNSDGSYSDGAYQHNTAITSFAMLAFMSQGHLPNQGNYGPEVAKAGRFLVASQRDKDPAHPGKDGYLVGARGGNMYCHAMATLALAELYGQTSDDTLKPVVEKAAKLIVNSQNDDPKHPTANGGWRYEPTRLGLSDVSVTIMQVMALRAAKNAGLHVPDTTLKKAIAYIKSCYRADIGGFTYMPGVREPEFARTAAGLCVLFLTGEYEDKDKDSGRKLKNKEIIDKSAKFLESHFDGAPNFHYGHYYAAHAMHQVGGKRWEDWYGRLVKHFVTSRRQHADGSWFVPNGREVGPVYQTSIAVIVLSVPAHYLPIFQR